MKVLEITADSDVPKLFFPFTIRQFATSINPSYPGFSESQSTSYNFILKRKSTNKIMYASKMYFSIIQNLMLNDRKTHD